MGSKIFVLHIILGVCIICIGALADEISSTSTSVSVSTVTRKVTTKPVSKRHHGNTTEEIEIPTEEEVPVPVPKIQNVEASSQPSQEEGNGFTKPLKIKKKILVSNLKNISEKLVLPNDKFERQNLPKSEVNVTEIFNTKDIGKTSSSVEDDTVDETVVKISNSSNLVEVQSNKSSRDGGSKSKDIPIEGRSLEDRSSEENVNVKPKIKYSTNATERTSFTYENVGDIKKVLSNNLLHNERYQQRVSGNSRPVPSVILPTKKSPAISTDNSLKNTIRFENDYYGPSGQTDWVPIIPDKLPVRPVPGDFGNKLRVPERLNKTSERIIFPSDDVRPVKESNAIPVQEINVEKTTTHQRNGIEKQRVGGEREDEKPSHTISDPARQPIKFRGPVKYKTWNATLEALKLQNETFIRNGSVTNSERNTSTTKVPWTLATLGRSTTVKPTVNPIQMDTTEVSVFTVLSSTNYTKSQKPVDGRVVVPPENLKMNLTKENSIRSSTAGTNTTPFAKQNESDFTSNLPKLLETNDSWTPLIIKKDGESINDTEVIIPGSVDVSLRNSSKIEEIKTSTDEPVLITTENTTENVEVVTTTKTTETEEPIVFSDISSQISSNHNSSKNFTELPKTDVKVNRSDTAEVFSNSTTEDYEPKTTKFSGVDIDADIETTTEVEQTTTTKQNIDVQNTTEIPFHVENTNQKRVFLKNKTSTTPVPETTTETTAGTAKNSYLRKNTTSTVFAPTTSFKLVNTTTPLSTNMTSTTTTPATTHKYIQKSTSAEIPTTQTITQKSTAPTTQTFVQNSTTSTTQTFIENSTSIEIPITETPTQNSRITVIPTTQSFIHNFTSTTVVSETSPKIVQNITTSVPVYVYKTKMEAVTPKIQINTTSSTTTVTTPTSTNNQPKTTTTARATTFTTTTMPTTKKTSTTTAKPFVPDIITTMNVKDYESKPETTEEGIYYKNYVPTTINFHDEITEENVPAYLRLTVQASSWEELCRLKEDLRDSIIKMLGGKNVSSESVHFLNLNDKNCHEKIEETRRDSNNSSMFLPVNMFLMDKNGDFDKNLSEAFLTLWGREGLDFELPIRKVDFVTPIVNLTELADSPLGDSVVAAIIISCVAGICVILLGVLFVIMKRRQKRFNYGQRCTPVSLDAYSLDSVSIHNSVRRKGMRASKRSYGNAAFDDPEVPTHSMNFAGLANFSSDKEQLYEEFNIIPQVYPKVEELPPGAETKNRYANIIPLPETRVHLSIKDGDTLSDYINANYVRGLKGTEKLYIACQAPMESTVEDFWRMVWEQQCKVILMLTDLQENGIEKCADYLPPNEVTDNLRLFGDFQVTLKKRDVKEKYIISNLVLKNMEANLWREVTHLWYLGWPDQGVPSEANSLIAFLIEARSQMKIQNGATTHSPAVVHCSPGTGRTGTVIACDLCIRDYEQTRMVDIPKCVFNIRRDRAGSVQTKDQYAFIYQVLNVYATKLSGGGIESI